MSVGRILRAAGEVYERHGEDLPGIGELCEALDESREFGLRRNLMTAMFEFDCARVTEIAEEILDRLDPA